MALDPKAVTDNYIRVDRWARKKYGDLPGVAKAHRDVLKPLDEQCKKCSMRDLDYMACSGYRRFFDDEQSDYRGRVIITVGPCFKQVARDVHERIDRRMRRAGIPSRLLEDIANNRTARTDATITTVHDSFLFEGRELPLFCKDVYSDDLQRRIFEYMFNMAEVGFQPKYFFMGDFAKRIQTAGGNYTLEDRVSDILDPDWLVVDRPDYWAGMEYVRNMFFEVLRERITKCRPTMFVVAPGEPTLRNDLEKQLFDMAEKWPRFTLP